MGWRKAHGSRKDSLVRIEVLPADELPAGVPDNTPPPQNVERGPHGQFAPGNKLSALGGKAKAGQVYLAGRLGNIKLSPTNAFAPYKRQAATFRRVQCATLAKTVGGGICGPAPSSIVASASISLAWSRYFSDQASIAADPRDAMEMATKSVNLGDKSRQALLTAHELCAKEAQSRPKKAFDPLAGWDDIPEANDADDEEEEDK